MSTGEGTGNREQGIGIVATVHSAESIETGFIKILSSNRNARHGASADPAGT
jgi:hypothetical protein